MEIPSYQDRINNRYGDEIKKLQQLINTSINNDEFRENLRGWNVLTVVIENWPDEELQKYLSEAYEKAGWELEFDRKHIDEDITIIEIYRKTN